MSEETSRLLTDEETQRARGIGGQAYIVAVQTDTKIPSLDVCCNRSQNTAQDAKTPSIKDAECKVAVNRGNLIGYEAGKAECQERVGELWEDIICPMCYRLNPQHATMDNGIGCHWCQDREDWQALKEGVK